MIAKLRRWWEERWARRDARRRAQMCQAAFQDGRFALYLRLYSGRRIGFLPTMEEAPTFFDGYVAPWYLGTREGFMHRSWDSGPPRLYASRQAMLECVRFRDVASVEVYAATPQALDHLDEALAQALERGQLSVDLKRADTARVLGQIQAEEIAKRMGEGH